MTRKGKILIVDDEPSYLELLKGMLEQEGYVDVQTEQIPTNVPSILYDQTIDLILLDIYMPEMNGIDLLEIIARDFPKIPVIVVTAVDDTDIAMQAVKLGAYEFITKPPDTNRLFLSIERALGFKLIEQERDTLRGEYRKSENRFEQFGNIITESDLMKKIFGLIEIFSPTNETVLITGETGTGKDLVAKKIHDLSPRKNKQFIAINLASISSSLFESELFGHEKGSFTGATEEKTGFFESANGGTIFLDEIGELPRSLQGKLLRTIQYSEIQRVGNPKPVKLDIRILAATNMDLSEAVERGEFRADLYYRLNRGYINLPPLKDRDNDVVILANHFLKEANATYNKKVTGFSQKVIASLKHYSFPGNVRELENIIFNSVVKAKDGFPLSSVDIPNRLDSTNNNGNGTSPLVSIDDAITQHIQSVMKQMGNSVQKAAPVLGVSERTLQRRLKAIREQRHYQHS